MNIRIILSSWIKICLSLLLALVIIILNRPANVASEQINQWSSYELYGKAMNAANNKDYIHAYAYLFAYVQQNPPDYANNINVRTDVDKTLDILSDEMDRLNYYILADISRCGNYPCNPPPNSDQTWSVVPSQSIQLKPPSDAVIVCTKPNYKGICNVLTVGNYRTHQSLGVPNDSIASVMVGSRVKITLYANAIGDSPLITFTQNDPDLSDNLISNKYRWSRSVSTAKVELK